MSVLISTPKTCERCGNNDICKYIDRFKDQMAMIQNVMDLSDSKDDLEAPMKITILCPRFSAFAGSNEAFMRES